MPDSIPSSQALNPHDEPPDGRFRKLNAILRTVLRVLYLDIFLFHLPTGLRRPYLLITATPTLREGSPSQLEEQEEAGRLIKQVEADMSMLAYLVITSAIVLACSLGLGFASHDVDRHVILFTSLSVIWMLAAIVFSTILQFRFGPIPHLRQLPANELKALLLNERRFIFGYTLAPTVTYSLPLAFAIWGTCFFVIAVAAAIVSFDTNSNSQTPSEGRWLAVTACLSSLSIILVHLLPMVNYQEDLVTFENPDQLPRSPDGLSARHNPINDDESAAQSSR